MALGNSAYGPEYFDSVMSHFSLTPEDVGATADLIEAAKKRWAEKQVG